MKESSNKRENIRDKIIGLGKDSIHKSYYPQLQHHIRELKKQKLEVEEKNKELIKTLVKLKKTQANLASSENRFRTLFENANDAIFIQDKTLKIIDCNQTALNLFKIKRENIVNQPPNIFIPDSLTNIEDVRANSLKFMRLALKGKPQVFELNISGGASTVTHILISLNRFELNGNLYLQAIVRDTTELKKLQQELLSATIKTEELERARFAKELHDGVGPILSTVKLYFQWLADTSEPEQRKVIIEKGNKNISEAIKALKEVSNNLSPHILTNYGLNEGIKQFTERLTATGKIKIRFSSNLDKRLNSEIEFTLYRVTTELINNTLKHANASLIHIIIDIKQSLLQYTYTDNGSGIERIKKLENAGLGLFNIQNRIQNLDGNFKIKSKPGKGVKVKININCN